MKYETKADGIDLAAPDAVKAWREDRLRPDAEKAIKRLRGVDGLIGVNNRLKRQAVPPTDILDEDSTGWLLLKMPDLIAIATWAHYALQREEEKVV